MGEEPLSSPFFSSSKSCDRKPRLVSWVQIVLCLFKLTFPIRVVFHLTTSMGAACVFSLSAEINAISTYEKNPLEKPFRIPNARMTSSYLLHQYWTFACHTIPAFLGDLYLRLMGKKPW